MAGWLPLAQPQTHFLQAEGGTYVFGGSQDVTLVVEPFRAQFSPELIAERLREDPEYFHRLAAHLAAEFGFTIQKIGGQTGNSVGILRGELTRLQEGFAQVAQSVAAKAYDQAATIIIALRDGLCAWWSSHPELVESVQSLSVITLGVVALHQLGGVEPNLSALIATSVAKGEKLSDILKSWMSKE